MYIVIILLFIAFLVWMCAAITRAWNKGASRRRTGAEAQAAREAEEAAAAAAAAEILAAAPTGGADIMEVNTEKSMELRKSVRQFAQNNPEIAAQMVKTWLKGEDTSA